MVSTYPIGQPTGGAKTSAPNRLVKPFLVRLRKPTLRLATLRGTTLIRVAPVFPSSLTLFHRPLTSRFVRVSDVILQKLFCGLDALELEDDGTLLDALNRAEKRAEKRGLIDTANDFRIIRELRNEIAHEYAQENLRPFFESVLDLTSALLDIIRRAHTYCRRYF